MGFARRLAMIRATNTWVPVRFYLLRLMGPRRDIRSGSTYPTCQMVKLRSAANISNCLQFAPQKALLASRITRAGYSVMITKGQDFSCNPIICDRTPFAFLL